MRQASPAADVYDAFAPTALELLAFKAGVHPELWALLRDRVARGGRSCKGRSGRRSRGEAGQR